MPKIFLNKDGWKDKECKCKKPILQEATKQCGKCNAYIDRVKHILLTNPGVKPISHDRKTE